jgi:hypothetical protein
MTWIFIGPWHLRQVVSVFTTLRSVVTGIAGKVHQLFGHRCLQVASMECVLVAGVGTEPLIPGLAGAGLDACR